MRFVSSEDAVADGEVTIRPDGAATCGGSIITESTTADVGRAVVDDGCAASVAEATCNGADSDSQRAAIRDTDDVAVACYRR